METIEEPIFLVGSVRSGTTLLGDMLDHHPDISFPGEFEMAVDFIGPGGELPDLSAYHAWLQENRHFIWHRLRIDPALSYRDLVHSLLAQMKVWRGEKVPKAQVGVTVHRRFGCLLELWPRARFVHLVRDPRDVGASIIAQGWAGNHYTACRQWREVEEEWDRTRPRIDVNRRLEVRFEELVARPREELSRICELAGLPYREEMMSYPEDSTYEEVDPAMVGRWRLSLSPRAVRLAEAGAAELLPLRGYEPSGLPPLTIGGPRRRLLEAHCRLEQLRRRIRQYGASLWVQRKLATVLRLDGWRRRVLMREHEIMNRMMK